MATFVEVPSGWKAIVRRSGYPLKSKNFRSKALAEHWAMALEIDIERGKAGLGRKQMTVRALVEKFRNEIVDLRKGGEQDGYRLNRFLNDAPVVLLDQPADSPYIPQYLREWRDTRLERVSGPTVLRELNVVRAVFKTGIKEGWVDITANPIALISLPEASKPRTQRCTTEQLEKIVGPLPTVAPKNTADFICFAAHFAVETAMRQGEICQLTWSDIDVQRRVAVVKDEASEGKSVKNGRSRDVPLSKRACQILQDLSDFFPDGEDGDRVFQLSGDLCSQRFGEMADAAELGQIRFHDLRREATSRLAKKVPIETLAKITGHMDMKTLLQTYYRPDMSDVASMLD
jgi:integrase